MSANSAFIKNVIEKAKKDPRHIVYPEGEDKRVLEAAYVVAKEKIATVTILGNEQDILSFYSAKGFDPSGITLIDPAKSPDMPHFSELFYLLRKQKGVTIEQAKDTVKLNNYFGTLLLYEERADGLVSGASHSTSDTVRPALQIIKSTKKTSIVSSMFFMCFPQKTFVFADSGLIEDPDAAQLADIAVQSALTAIAFDISPSVALLSYSTKGSAQSHLTEKVVKATALAREKISRDYPDLGIRLDGELQGDAALVPDVAKKKCPESEIQGDASVLIFPNLDSGNIAYKLAQRLGGAEAYGPILQGLKKPVNDLSRGCSVEDIVGVTAITVVQSQMINND